MQRIVMALAGCALAVSMSGGLARATGAEAGPVTLGGRIEVPTAGFALSLPEGWYAFDISHPDIVSEAAAFDETTALLVPELEGLPMPRWMVTLMGMEVVLLAFDSDFEASCDVTTEKLGGKPLDTIVSEEMEWRRDSPAVEGDIESAFIDLPAGRTGVIEYVDLDKASPEVTVFILVHDERSYVLSCEDSERQTDRWLAIAESFEFLPEE